MPSIRVFVAVLTVLAIAGCATPASAPSPTKYPTYYSHTQATRLKLCLSLSDTVRAMSEMKADGKSQTAVLSYYKARDVNQDTIEMLAEKVFSEDSSQIWNYTIDAMGECATKVAQISSFDHVKAAQFCMQKQLIAQVSKTYGAKGDSINAVFEHFKQLRERSNRAGQAETDEAINTGFSWKGERSGLFDQIGNPCIDRYSARS